jgi:hypothetical protein
MRLPSDKVEQKSGRRGEQPVAGANASDATEGAAGPVREVAPGAGCGGDKKPQVWYPVGC